MQTEELTMHMIITGDAIQTFARNALHRGKLTEIGVKYSPSKRLGKARYVLNSLKPKLTEEQQDKILSGDAYLKGESICDKPECDQCKGKEPITFVDEEDFNFKLELKDIEIEKKDDEIKEIQEEFYIDEDWKERKQKREERIKEERKEKKIFKDATTSKASGKVKIGNYMVSKKLIEEYVKLIEWQKHASIISFSRTDPAISANALALRITKHKELFKDAGLSYHGDDELRKRDFTDPEYTKSREFYDEIEKYIEKEHPKLSKENRAKRSGETSEMIGMMRSLEGEESE